MSELLKRQLNNEFEGGIAKTGYEFAKNLAVIDTLEKDKLNNMLTLFNKRLIVFQTEFLDCVAKTAGNIEGKHIEPNIGMGRNIAVLEPATAVIVGGTGAVLTNLITISSTSGWIFTTTTTSSVAAYLASQVGVVAGVAITASMITAGVGVVAGGAVFIGTKYLMKNHRREKIRKKIIKEFDSKTVPTLRKWAQNIINISF